MLATMLVAVVAFGAPGDDQDLLKFERQRISDVTYEAASAVDLNKDGVLDIASGEYWFEGPDFTKRHKMCELFRQSDYYDDFGDYPMDVNGDGYADIVTGGWWGKKMQWRENPKGQDGPWTIHDIAETGNVERPCFYDIDGDGEVEIIPNCPSSPVSIFKLVKNDQGNGTGTFKQTTITEGGQGHGLGFGDVNGDGRADVILNSGWLEAPEDPYTGTWTPRKEFALDGHASVPIIVHDVNGDGKNDLIVGGGHSYVLNWWEQGAGDDGARTWTKHEIDTERSQYHDLRMVDIDNDGEPELVTGKRYRAHCGNDPGGNDPIGLYYFELNGGQFKRITLDYGPPDKASGAGIFFWVEDLDGNGWKDIIAPGKEGLYIFWNHGKV